MTDICKQGLLLLTKWKIRYDEFMRHIPINAYFPEAPSVLWNMFTNMESYSRYALFVKSAKVVTDMKEGGLWYDISTILWLPVRYDHYITKFIPCKELEFTIYPTTGGKIVQSFVLKQEGKGTRITGGITVDLKWKILDFLIGPMLEKRLQIMLQGTITNVRHLLG